MTHEPQVARRQVEITNPLGLHMRPADLFVKLASTFAQTEVIVRHHDQSYNGKSIIDLTMIAAECGTVLELEARGPQAEAALAALVELVRARFHEDDDGQPVPVEASTP